MNNRGKSKQCEAPQRKASKSQPENSPPGENPLHSIKTLKNDAGEELQSELNTLIDNMRQTRISLDLAEKELRDNQEFFRGAKTYMLDGYWRADRHGKLLDVNLIYCQQSGYSREELLKMKIHDLEAEVNNAKTAARMNNIIENGMGRFDSVHRRKDQSTWHVEISAAYRAIGEGEFIVFLRDISERKYTEEELERYRCHLEDLVFSRTEQLRAISTQLTLTEERERRCLAQDLHDNLGQLLAVIKIKLTSLTANTPRSSVNQIVELVDQTIQAIRMVTLQLSPPIMYTLGLVPALEWLADEMGRTYCLVVHCDFGDVCQKPLSEAANALLYRSVRELLINVARHAKAGEANLSCQREGNRLILVVSDDGCGFNPDDALSPIREHHSMGLGSIYERISSIGGDMLIDSSPGGGATITLSVPCPIEKKDSP